MDKISEIQKKTEDFWSRHNITTRMVITVMLILFAGTIIASWLGHDIKHFDKIVDILSDNLLWLTALIVAGINGASVLLDKYHQISKNKLNEGKQDD